MQVVGAYRLQGEVGRGGAGSVHRALAPDGRTVAVKLLLWSGGAQRETRGRRFAQELEALRRLRHPGVMEVLDAGEHPGPGGTLTPYLVLEWIDGESLAARLSREKRLLPAAAAELVGRLALAVAHCHAAGVLHRDLKPANVLLRAGGDPVLGDFGLARDFLAERTRLTATGAWLGTPGWWAPEVLRGASEDSGPAVDVYGLGALLFGCLTGRAPQEGVTLTEVLVASARPPRAPSELDSGVPPELDAICLRALSLDPAARQPTAQAFADELRAWLGGRRGSRANPALVRGPAGPARPASSRAALLVALLTCTAGLLGALAIVLLRSTAAPGAAPPPIEPTPQVASPPPDAPPIPEPPGRQEALALLRQSYGMSDAAASLQLCDRAIELDPTTPSAHYNRGVRREALGDHRGAWADYDAELTVQPDYTPAILNRGLARQALGDVQGALQDYELVLKLDPKQAKAWSNRGMVRFAQGDLRGALDDMDRSLSLDRSDPVPFMNRGSARMRVGDLQGALQDYDQAIALSPREQGYYCNRAIAHRHLGDMRAAFADHARAIELAPRNPFPLCQRGYTLEETGDLQGALADYERALAIDPRHAQALFGRASVRQQSADFQGAVADYDQALLITPQDGITWFNRGLCKQGLGDVAGALADWERALALQPGAEWAQRAHDEIARVTAR